MSSRGTKLERQGLKGDGQAQPRITITQTIDWNLPKTVSENPSKS